MGPGSSCGESPADSAHERSGSRLLDALLRREQATAGGLQLRSGMAQDAERLTELHRSARATAMPWLAVVHDERSTREWFEHVVVPRQRVTVAVRHSRVVGFSASTEGWLEQLYVAPSDQGCGVGRALLDDVTAAHPGGLQLWVFARNEGARRFYETAGFVLEEQTDGQGNEEREPDCRYCWPGA